MGNGIAERQNEPLNLQKLAAQRELYSHAKTLATVQMVVACLVPVVLSILAIVLKNQAVLSWLGWSKLDWSWGVAVYSGCIAAFDLLVLNPYVERSREKAARIQESFDCDVLALPWNGEAAGPQPSYEEVMEWAGKYKGKHADSSVLKDWYAEEVDRVPLHVARILCQRSNARWDSELRNKFIVYLLAATTGLFLVLLIGALSQDLSLRTFFESIVAPFAPIVVFAGRQISQNRRAIESLGDLRQRAQHGWGDALESSGNEQHLDSLARRLQDAIFANRKRNPLIPDWIYEKRKSELQKQDNFSSRQLAKDYFRKHGPS